MTNSESTLNSLLELLNLNEEKKENVLDIILESDDAQEFLEAFEIEDAHLLEKKVELVSLHSITSSDKCKSVKELGLINLQKAVSQDTPLKNYLSKKEIHINIEDKYIINKGNKLDISEITDGFALSDDEEYRNRVIHKLYDDFQVNAFLYRRNVASYEGETRNRPEILLNLANFLKDDEIESDWVKDVNNVHYIIKFKQPLNYYKYWTYVVEYEDEFYGITKDSLEYLTFKEIEVKVKRWLIQKSIEILKNDIYELFSYIRPEVIVEPKDIMEIMSEEEYFDKYKSEIEKEI